MVLTTLRCCELNGNLRWIAGSRAQIQGTVCRNLLVQAILCIHRGIICCDGYRFAYCKQIYRNHSKFQVGTSCKIVSISILDGVFEGRRGRHRSQSIVSISVYFFSATEPTSTTTEHAETRISPLYISLHRHPLPQLRPLQWPDPRIISGQER
jgi:hypothetical protein